MPEPEPVDIHVEDVFTPDDNPTYTYVHRSDDNSESILRDVTQNKHFVVSISGPSKCGKTVSVRRVFGESLIEVSGANLSKASDLWDRVLDWMEVPSSRTTTNTAQASGGGGLNLPLFSARAELASGDAVAETYYRGGLSQVISEIGDSEFVIFVDDFHYIEREVQEELSKQIKHAFECGVKVVAASVPHRAEDLLRSNPELRGRLVSIDIDYWKPDDLNEIGVKGFSKLKMEVEHDLITRLAVEACGSPQLMQAICQFMCYECAQAEQGKIKLHDHDVRMILDRTTVKCNFSDLLGKLHSGSKTRGTERKVFSFKDGSRGTFTGLYC